mmetsp:Transcript_34585/g.83534  ORF Transcript_34585/g.83534 Transcript_34585/m.83534 type:complete len:80 (+) Transcript_34585:1410-1649(+)
MTDNPLKHPSKPTCLIVQPYRFFDKADVQLTSVSMTNTLANNNPRHIWTLNVILEQERENSFHNLIRKRKYRRVGLVIT